MQREDSNKGREAVEASDYYLSVPDKDVQTSFHCLDDPSNLQQLVDTVENGLTGSFLVDFSDDTAWAAFDLPTKSIQALFTADRPDTLSTRWLNLWNSFQHRSILELLGRRYDFSPRLLGLMCSDPKLPRNRARDAPHKPVIGKRSLNNSLSTVEMFGAGTEQVEDLEYSQTINSDSMVGGNLFEIASHIWNYSSIDFGRQFVCIGYNSLYDIKRSGIKEENCSAPLPDCVRVWTWLIICEDRTVISINEDPFPFAKGRLTSSEDYVLSEVRRSVINVFRSLSLATVEPLSVNNPLLLLPIRTRLGRTPEESAHRDSDTPGLLFYYLFENWHNSYMMIHRKESRYGDALSTLRSEMLLLPTLNHIDHLDRIGKELSVLRRHYQAYKRLIDRLLEPIAASPASLQNSQVVTNSSQVSLNTVRPIVTEHQSLMGVSLSSAARMRFKRLRDIIDLYALSEVEQHIQQKEAMVSMNFSLIAIKQSVDVERLTRITLLLTKATILFLPVSLSTAYFGADLANVEYSIQTYWISFGAILFASWLTLVLLGVLNGTVQTAETIFWLWKGVRIGARGTTQKVKEIMRNRRQ